METNGGAHAFTAEADTYARDGAFASANFGTAPLLSISRDAENHESFLRFALTNVFAQVPPIATVCISVAAALPENVMTISFRTCA